MTGLTSISSQFPATLQGPDGPAKAFVNISPSRIEVFYPPDKSEKENSVGKLYYTTGYMEQSPYFHVSWISRETSRCLMFELDKIGSVLIEALVATAFHRELHTAKAINKRVTVGKQEYTVNGLITLKSLPNAIFFYWRLGFRPHPTENIRLHPECEDIWKSFEQGIPLDPNKQRIYEKRKALVAREKNASASELTPEDVCKIDLTVEINKLIAKTSQENPELSLGEKLKDLALEIPFVATWKSFGLPMYLTPEGQEDWKRRILFRARIHHDKELLDHLLFEAVVVDISPNVAKILGEYLL